MMEIQKVASMRLESGSVWSSANDVFSRSSMGADDVDDEEALRWAALEKLPTRDRVRRAILQAPAVVPLPGPAGVVDVDVLDLGPVERRALLERLVRVADEDHERFLVKLKERLERVGIEMPTIEVRFEHLEVEAEVRVGGSGLPTVLNSITNTLEEAATAMHLLRSRKRTMPILHDVSGIIKPRRMTLLLGPPGSGKTTLLMALAGRLKDGKDGLKDSGRVTYNGHSMEEFVPERTAAYISQQDLHIPEMTVRETLAFSARCQGASAVGGNEASVILGLESCADTMVGDEMLRGISGGQRKRVTTGEMLVGPAKAFFMDEISTGLDTSTTFQIVNSLRQSIHVLGGTAVISLLQPAPETYRLFDDIILLSDGQIVYQGPREDVMEFFKSMGFICPERKGVADFLQQVISRKDQKQYWAWTNKPYRFVSVKEFATAFMSFHTRRAITKELSVPFNKSRSHPAALTTTRYGTNSKELLKANIDREILLMKRNSFVYAVRTFQLTLMSLIAMSVFFHTTMKHDSVTSGGIYIGAMFFGILVIMYNGFSELALTVIRLPIFFKQRDLLFYPAWAYTVPPWILKIPITLIEVCGYVFLTYYVIGFDPNVGSKCFANVLTIQIILRFVKHYLIMLAVNQMGASLFRLIGGATRNMVIANIFAMLIMMTTMVFNGFILIKDKVKKRWIWGYWINPLMYAQNAITVNEMLGHSWDKILNSSVSRKTLGVQVLSSRDVFPEANWYWIGLGAMLGFTVLNSRPSISEDELELKHSNMKRAIIDVDTLVSRKTFQPIGDNNGTTIQMFKDDSITIQRGMVLPFLPLSLSFDDIRYSEMKAQGAVDDRLTLLKGVSGSFRPGILTALMGVSGAGKTTLMDVLAGRKTGGYTEGNISISGYPKNQETFTRVSGYCEQNDIHSPHVTVFESMLFSAWLRLPKDVNSNTRKMFIEEVMELVDLKPLRDALVGLPGVNGLSTEQRKRLTIAVELVANPSIIFMDEPTSGLDAQAAAIVMRTVRNTVDTGRTVVCTIHQPSIDIFEAFDELFLMKRGGEEIYAGPLGHNSSELIKYFEGIQDVSNIKHGYNPATWILEVTTVSQEEMLGVNFSDIYKKSELYRDGKTDHYGRDHLHRGPGVRGRRWAYASSPRSNYYAAAGYGITNSAAEPNLPINHALVQTPATCSTAQPTRLALSGSRTAWLELHGCLTHLGAPLIVPRSHNHVASFPAAAIVVEKSPSSRVPVSGSLRHRLHFAAGDVRSALPAISILPTTVGNSASNLRNSKFSFLSIINKALIKELSQPTPGSSDLYFPTKYSQSSLVQCMACLWKQNMSYWRNPPYNTVRFIFAAVTGFIFGTVFWDIGGKIVQSQDLFNAMGSMYAAVLFLGAANSITVQSVVAIERTVFYRERAAGMYSSFPYAFGQVVIELPYALVQVSIYGIIVYAMMGFEWTAAKFFWYLFFMYFTLLYFTFYGMMAVGLTPNYQIASVVSTTFYRIWSLFSGFFIPRPKMPIWWRWYCWICPMAWTLYGLTVSQYSNITTPMDDGRPVKVFLEDYFDFRHSWLCWVAAIVVAFSVFFATIFSVAIMNLNFQKR
ncbi:hypothetical protein U9M48_013825 [Paspalum notatum var. saurae]|uniref:ABC transporter domain-containing protein n=1 Tax=Paspalum notatum var. saurae TaxID=547442 RepID=A0AAQ3T163_PASNO